jgi:hypothetical protein
LWGTGWQLANKAARSVVDLNTYVTFRMIDTAAPPTFSFLEIPCGEITDRELYSPELCVLRETAYFCAAVDDDLLSYGKELWCAGGGRVVDAWVAGNIVDVLLPEHDHDLGQVLRHAVELRDRVMHLFVLLRDSLWDDVDGRPRRYPTGLGDAIRQNIQWSLTTPRYRNPDGRHPDAVLTRGGVHDRPPADRDRIPIPTISWWWDHLPVSEAIAK